MSALLRILEQAHCYSPWDVGPEGEMPTEWIPGGPLEPAVSSVLPPSF